MPTTDTPTRPQEAVPTPPPDDRIPLRSACRQLDIAVGTFYGRYGDPLERGISPAYADVFGVEIGAGGRVTLSRARLARFIAGLLGSELSELPLPGSPRARGFRREPLRYIPQPPDESAADAPEARSAPPADEVDGDDGPEQLRLDL